MFDLSGKDVLDSLKTQHATFVQQREQTQVNLQQLIGAIYACEMMIKDHEQRLMNAVKEHAEGAQENGETDNESQE